MGFDPCAQGGERPWWFVDLPGVVGEHELRRFDGRFEPFGRRAEVPQPHLLIEVHDIG